MKRDIELMRKILFEIEDKYVEGEGADLHIKIQDYSMAIIAEHCDLLYQAGLIKDYNPMYADDSLHWFFVGNLTNSGYDYLELIRNEDTWVKTKEEVRKKELPQTIETIGTVAASIVGSFMREYNR